jgi:hypothetical protein
MVQQLLPQWIAHKKKSLNYTHKSSADRWRLCRSLRASQQRSEEGDTGWPESKSLPFPLEVWNSWIRLHGGYFACIRGGQVKNHRTKITAAKFKTALDKDQILWVTTHSTRHNCVRDAKKFTKSLHTILLNVNVWYRVQNTTSIFPAISQISLEHNIQPPI